MTEEAKPEGWGACKKCDCKEYSPYDSIGHCGSKKSDGGTCEHKAGDHK